MMALQATEYNALYTMNVLEWYCIHGYEQGLQSLSDHARRTADSASGQRLRRKLCRVVCFPVATIVRI
jgi:hypothetical protein